MIASGSAYAAQPQPVTYTRACLLVLRQQAMPILSSDVIARVHILGIGAYAVTEAVGLAAM